MENRSSPIGRLAVFERQLDGRTGTIRLGEVVDAFGPAAIGIMLLLLTIPTLLPIPGPVGLLFGSILVFVSLQIMVGARRLWLPDVVRRRPLPIGIVRATASYGIAVLDRSQVVVKPRRLLPMTGRVGRIALAVPLLLMAIAIAMPIPFGNFLPAISLMALALGITMRDGLVVLIGLALAMVAALWLAVLFLFGSQILTWMAALVSG